MFHPRLGTGPPASVLFSIKSYICLPDAGFIAKLRRPRVSVLDKEAYHGTHCPHLQDHLRRRRTGCRKRPHQRTDQRFLLGQVRRHHRHGERHRVRQTERGHRLLPLKRRLRGKDVLGRQDPRLLPQAGVPAHRARHPDRPDDRPAPPPDVPQGHAQRRHHRHHRPFLRHRPLP